MVFYLIYKLNKKPFIFASKEKYKLCQKEHFNPLIEKEKTSMVLWIVCPLLMGKKCYLEEEQKGENG